MGREAAEPERSGVEAHRKESRGAALRRLRAPACRAGEGAANVTDLAVLQWLCFCIFPLPRFPAGEDLAAAMLATASEQAS